MQLNFVNISVQDLDRTVEFYRRIFEKDPVSESDRLVEFEFDGVKIGLYSPEEDSSEKEVVYGNNCFPGFRVDNLDVERERISEFADIVSENEVNGHRWITFEDPDGNLIEFYDGHL